MPIFTTYNPPYKKPLYLLSIGDRFGKLIVLELPKVEDRKYLTKCLCDCGTITMVRKYHLLKDKRGTRSCGCVQILPFSVAAKNSTLTMHKRRARKENHVWELTNEQAMILFEANCFYCAMPPSNIFNRFKLNGEFKYSGIDRMDNNIGYTLLNSVPCCNTCNKMKSNRSLIDFMEKINTLYNNLNLAHNQFNIVSMAIANID